MFHSLLPIFYVFCYSWVVDFFAIFVAFQKCLGVNVPCRESLAISPSVGALAAKFDDILLVPFRHNTAVSQFHPSGPVCQNCANSVYTEISVEMFPQNFPLFIFCF